MDRPPVGIAMDHAAEPPRAMLRDAYYEAVWAAGGLPLLLPPLGEQPRAARALLERVRALLVPGGDDYHPALWGESIVHPSCTLVTARRQAADLALLAAALARGLPLLAICAGMQALNVVRGGSVIQDLAALAPSAQPHRAPAGEAGLRHPVLIEADSLLGRLGLPPRLEVNSCHHQACGRLGSGLRAVARAPDGVVEAIEDPRLPFALGVQWHPEKLLDEPAHRALFEGLCAAAAGPARPPLAAARAERASGPGGRSERG
ncbi:MAG: peptidase C26 [Planctomycetota bacterium]|nr:MAG: peptidase C26 [Planctomycetota bacterium]